MKRFIAISLIVIGLILICIPFLVGKIIDYKTKKGLAILDDLDIKTIK
ncbi:MAG: hypothetical protein GX974_08095 [Clostridiales bacterium]|nr:hypothetical protein [Clostridiales bacterium]